MKNNTNVILLSIKNCYKVRRNSYWILKTGVDTVRPTYCACCSQSEPATLISPLYKPIIRQKYGATVVRVATKSTLRNFRPKDSGIGTYFAFWQYLITLLPYFGWYDIWFSSISYSFGSGRSQGSWKVTQGLAASGGVVSFEWCVKRNQDSFPADVLRQRDAARLDQL